jgi:hypothetical protein
MTDDIETRLAILAEARVLRERCIELNLNPLAVGQLAADSRLDREDAAILLGLAE